jgi:diphthine-ammonia ligase
LEFVHSIPQLKHILDLSNPVIGIPPESEPFIEEIGPYYLISTSASATPDTSIAQCTANLLNQFQKLFQSKNLNMSDIIQVNVFVKEMSEFLVFNKAYQQYFNVNPPTRVTVQLEMEHPLQIDIIAFKENVSLGFKNEFLHVQGLSYWAPANIGYFFVI